MNADNLLAIELCLLVVTVLHVMLAYIMFVLWTRRANELKDVLEDLLDDIVYTIKQNTREETEMLTKPIKLDEKLFAAIDAQIKENERKKERENSPHPSRRRSDNTNSKGPL